MGADFLSTTDSANLQSTLRLLADSAKILVWMTDVNDMCIYLNPSASSVFPQWKNFSISGWTQFIHPEDLERVKPIFGNARQTHSEYQVEYRIIRSDGSTRWLMGSGAPRFSQAGIFLGYNGTILDVSDRHEAQDALAKSEAGHRLLNESSTDLVSHYAVDGTFIYASPSYTKVLGYEVSELIGTYGYEILHPDDVDAFQRDIARQIAGAHDGTVLEIRKRHKNGSYIWMGTKVRVLFDPATHNPSGAVAVSRDISFERRAREELKIREERFRSLTNLSSDWYWETDEYGYFTFISDGVQQISGGLPQQYIDKTPLDLVKNRDQPGVAEYIEKVAARLPFKDIRYAIDEQAFGSVSGEPIFKDGVFKGYRGIGRDITSEVEAAHKLAELADANKGLIENSLDIMAMVDQDGRFLRINNAVKDVLGYMPEELIGRPYADFLVKEELEKTKAVDNSLRTGKNTIQDFETSWVKKDGAIVRLSLAVRWSDDKKALYATARDITEQYHVRSELQRSKDQLVSVLESIGDAFFALDIDWRISYANRKTAEFVGRSQHELIGKMLWEAVPDIVDSQVFPYYQEAMSSGKDAFFESYYEPVGAWVDVRVYAHRDGLSVFFHDITEQRKAEDAVRASEQRLRNVIEMTPAGYIFCDASGELLDVNPALCCLAGYAEEELVGRHISLLFPICPCNNALSVQNGISAVHAKDAVIRCKNGSLKHILINANIERNGEGHGVSLTAFVTDITERKQSEARLEHLATHDILTGLPNRSLLSERLQEMLDSAASDDSIAVIFIDLDGFKEVNDSMGHEPGDVLLCEVANRLKSVMHPQDLIGRLGGDEFIVATHCSGDKNLPAIIADRLLYTLSYPFFIEEHEVFVSASLGISMYPHDATRQELLLQNADTAMYRAKAAGRNRYCFFESKMGIALKTRMTLGQSLRRALEREEFELYYQPRIDLKTMTVIGMEALIRWNHPHLGRIPPLQFIPIAEERGLIEAIGLWVLKQACRQTRHFMDKCGQPLCISVNLSARQLQSRGLPEQVLTSLQEAALPVHLLELELTETALIEDMEVSARVLKELKEIGIMLAVDDFGTGYSGLAYLQRFPLDVLKLDRSFINYQADGVDGDKFVRAFIDLAHTLNLSVVAEGIELNETLDFLRNALCDEGQGFLLSKPLSSAEFERFLETLNQTSEHEGN
jgi:diguanylate cyclase (GGDEF)-like protein/PAS domain S-box-containing protein